MQLDATLSAEQTCAPPGGTGHCAPGASQVCPCRAAGNCEFVVGEMASRPLRHVLPLPLRAVPSHICCGLRPLLLFSSLLYLAHHSGWATIAERDALVVAWPQGTSSSAGQQDTTPSWNAGN